MKNTFLFSFLFLFFLYATMTLGYVIIETFQKIQFIFLFLFDDWRRLYYVFLKMFHSVQIPLISSLRNIYLRHAVFNF